MLAGGTNEISGEFITFVFIAANLAAPDGLAGFAGGWRLWFWFDILVIVGIGCRGSIV